VGFLVSTAGFARASPKPDRVRYDFVIEGSDHSVVLESVAGGGWTATVGEHRFCVESWSPGQLMLSGSHSLRYGYSWDGPLRQGQVILEGRPVNVALAPSRSQAARSGKSQGGAVKAPMNGQVVKVLKQPGETVAAGEVILVLEAMKMENEVTSPIAGVLEFVSTSIGQAVAAGAPLFQVKGE
jgi:biotin carboxyl carrier protein